MSRFRLLFAIAVLVALATALVACGGDDNGGGGSEDPQKVLDQTFSGDNEKVDSGNLSIKLNVEATGDDGGTLDAELSGPFESEGENKVPKFDLTANASLSAQPDEDFSFDGGLTSTGDAAFVGYNGTDYEVDQSLFDQFKQQVESAAGQQNAEPAEQPAAARALGIEDPQSLLTNLTNEGTEDVEGTETTTSPATSMSTKTVDAFKNLLSNASLLGQLGGRHLRPARPRRARPGHRRDQGGPLRHLLGHRRSHPAPHHDRALDRAAVGGRRTRSISTSTSRSARSTSRRRSRRPPMPSPSTTSCRSSASPRPHSASSVRARRQRQLRSGGGGGDGAQPLPVDPGHRCCPEVPQLHLAGQQCRRPAGVPEPGAVAARRSAI